MGRLEGFLAQIRMFFSTIHGRTCGVGVVGVSLRASAFFQPMRGVLGFFHQVRAAGYFLK
jgi:hypothetical protein